MRYVVVGASAAGLAAAEAVLGLDPGADLTLLTDEPHPPYCRPLLSYALAGDTPDSLFPLPSPALTRLDLRTDTRAVALEPREKRLRLASGEALAYDRLCLATGAGAKSAGLPGEGAPNVVGFRTRADLAAIEAELARGARRAAVLGGGLVGVKAAQALAARGLETALFATSGHLLSQAADAPAAALVAAALEAEGVRVEVGARPVSLVAEGGRVTGVRFAPPRSLEPCDLVVVGKGVAPRTELVAGFGFDATRGVAADGQLRTPLADVWVAGDAALTHDVAWNRPRPNPLWPLAVEQGTLAGRNLAGAAETYPGSLAMNSLRIGDLHLVSAGIVTPPDPTYQEHPGPQGQTYRKLVTHDGVLVGAVFAGDADQAGLLVSAVRAGMRLEELPFDPLGERIHWGRYAFGGQ